MIFKKPEPSSNGDNARPLKSKWQYVIDQMTVAHNAMGEAMNALSMINFDLQKGADFIARYRESLIKTIHDAGGEVEQGSVEEQIRDFIPKAVQRERVDEAN